MRLTIAVALLLVAVNAAAAVYKWTKPDGSVIYSDRPPTDTAAPADLPPVQEITIVPPATAADQASGGEEESSRQSDSGASYTKLTITSPEDQSVLRDNSGDVGISVNVQPALKPGDRLAIVLDGKQIGEGAGTSINLSNVDRGTHTLQVAVKNGDGNTLIESSPVTFTVKRTSLFQPKR